MSTKRRLIVLAVLVALHLAADLVVLRGERIGNDWLMAAGLGFCIAQVNLIATWAALATGRLMVRLPWALLLGVLMWYSLLVGQSNFATVTQDRIPPETAAVLGISILFGILVIQVPLWIANRGFGWRLVLSEDEPNGLKESQFYLSHLLVGTFLLCVALGLGRLVLPGGRFETRALDRELWILLPVVASCNLLVTSPCIWTAFARWKTLPLLAGLWIVYALLVTVLEVGLLTALLGSSGPGIEYKMFLLNLSQCVTVWGTMLVLRVTGFRLLRRRRLPTALGPAPAGG